MGEMVSLKKKMIQECQRCRKVAFLFNYFLIARIPTPSFKRIYSKGIKF